MPRRCGCARARGGVQPAAAARAGAAVRAETARGRAVAATCSRSPSVRLCPLFAQRSQQRWRAATPLAPTTPPTSVRAAPVAGARAAARPASANSAPMPATLALAVLLRCPPPQRTLLSRPAVSLSGRVAPAGRAVRHASSGAMPCNYVACRAAAAAPSRARTRLTQRLTRLPRAACRPRSVPGGAEAAGQPGVAGAEAGAGVPVGIPEAEVPAVALPKEVTQPLSLLAFNKFASDRRRELKAAADPRAGADAEKHIGTQWKALAQARPPANAALRRLVPCALRNCRSPTLRPIGPPSRQFALTRPLRSPPLPGACRTRRTCTSSAPRRTARASWPLSSVRRSVCACFAPRRNQCAWRSSSAAQRSAPRLPRVPLQR